MSEFFLELFTEEIPASLQKDSRNFFLSSFNKFFTENKINFKKSSAFSTPNRLVILFEGLEKELLKTAEEIKGPNTNAPEQALNGFLKSNEISIDKVFKKKTEKGEFYFYKTSEKKIKTLDLIEKITPKLLDQIHWKKSMRWGKFDLKWARPLKSILAVFDKKTLKFEYHHLISSNKTFVDKEFEDKRKMFNNFRTYKNYFAKLKIIIDQNERKRLIEKEFKKISNKRKIYIKSNERLLEEVVNITDQPHILICQFDEKFLKIPEEILIITMQYHQKYFPTLNYKGNLTNEFLVVTNNKDIKGLIKNGNERVIEARLSDADFFWKKNKSQNLVKQVSYLKSMNYFKGLGSYFEKVQRMRKLGGIISDELLISKDKVELSASICKVDLVSDLVNEFPELQGVLGGYFAEFQGFDKEISLAISEHYLPVGIDSQIPKKPFSIALSLTDKIDTLVGFFGINQKPTSSKDPYALKRTALGIIRILIENNKELKIKDFITYSNNLYKNQDLKIINESLTSELINFLKDRFRYYMKEKKIRHDIILASTAVFDVNRMNSIYKKALNLNKVISNNLGQDIVATYKRAANILENEMKNLDIELNNSTDPGIFKTEYEKNLFKKINELKKYLIDTNRDEKYSQTLIKLSDLKKETFDFFDNVKVNDDDQNIKKNRLELLQMLCKTFENYIKFSVIESN
tara:strand:- start:1037 stop:3103 length:2067 start_codon:yes stop_codon:yes gene_type:complete